MNIMISGTHGLIGSELSRSLFENGHDVIPLGRDLTQPINFKNVDHIIHLAGEPIAKGRWTEAKKRRIRESRINSSKALARQLSQSAYKPSSFICASATGYYGNRAKEELSESAAKGEGFLADVCAEWEQVAQDAAGAGVRVINLRTGVVLSGKGGALAKMLPPFRMGLGGVIGSGCQYLSWINLVDMVSAIEFVMETDTLSGPVNFTAPSPVTNREFTQILGSILKRPTPAPIPAPLAKVVFGEMAEALLLSSARVLPVKLLNAEYKFKHKRLHDALEDILK